MAKPVAGHAFVVKSALGIDSVIDFLVLIMAVFSWFLELFFFDFFGIEKRPFKINIEY